MLCGCKARQEQNVLLSPLMADSSSGMCANCMRQKGKCMGLENHVSRENQVFWNYIKRPKKTPNDRHTMTQVYTGAIAQPTWIKADSKIDAWYDILGIKESSWKLMKAVWKLYEMYTSAPNKSARITGVHTSDMPPSCMAYWAAEQVADECVLTDGNKESPKTLGFLAQLSKVPPHFLGSMVRKRSNIKKSNNK